MIGAKGSRLKAGVKVKVTKKLLVATRTTRVKTNYSAMPRQVVQKNRLAVVKVAESTRWDSNSGLNMTPEQTMLVVAPFVPLSISLWPSTRHMWRQAARLERNLLLRPRQQLWLPHREFLSLPFRSGFDYNP